MPNRVKHAKERLIITRMILRIVKAYTCAYMQVESFGSVADEAVLLGAIYVGHYDRRPMTAAKLAGYAGIPRATVVRKLKRMEEDGLIKMVEGAACLVTSRLNSPQMLASYQENRREVTRAAAELSKLDTNTIAVDDVPT